MVLVVVIVRRFLRGCLVGVVLVELWCGCLVGVCWWRNVRVVVVELGLWLTLGFGWKVGTAPEMP